jgi:hypothetical protein
MHTTLRADDGAEIRVPNSLFFQKPLKRFRGEVQMSLDEQLTKQKPRSERWLGQGLLSTFHIGATRFHCREPFT